MTRTELYWFVKGAILATPACPDGNPCASCAADMVTDALAIGGHVKLTD